MKSYKTKAVLENLDSMIEFIIENISEFSKNDKKLEGQIRLVCEEAFVNVINYAYSDIEEDGYIEIIYEEDLENKTFSIFSIDSGIEFNPLIKSDPDLELPLEERPIGGLGIFMIKQIMSNVTYERKNGKNILFMQKKL